MAVVAVPAASQQVGRFLIEREIGRGAQGRVYLARDPRLERTVALKTLRLAPAHGTGTQDRVRRLLEEALHVGRLQHPNIVALHDAIEQNGVPWLVFEYVEGRTLEALVRDGPLAPERAVRLVRQVLAGVGHAHAQGVLHRDLKPGNVIVTRDDVARVMDFGIAARSADTQKSTGSLTGTPAYLPPEVIGGAKFTKAGDIYGAGLLLHELLTGAPAFSGETVYAILHQVGSGEVPRPSRVRPGVPERLDSVVATATARDPARRYADCEAMAAALAEWAEPAPAEEGDGSRASTVAFLLRRMRHKSDLPALASTIGSINAIVAAEDQHTTVLSNAILRDVSLTGKLLRVVNAAYYKQFGGAVSTISRAVSILGFTRVRNIALSLVLFEHLQNKAQAAHLKDEVAAAYLSGTIALRLVERSRITDAEEAFICAMFRHLGRLLVAFYLPEEAEAIARAAAAKGIAEERAVVEVLGVGYADIGQGVAREWNLPDVIVRSMEPIDPQVTATAALKQDTLRTVADYSGRLSDLARTGDERVRQSGLEVLSQRFGGAIPSSEANLRSLVRESVEVLGGDADFAAAGLSKADAVSQARQFGGGEPPDTLVMEALAEDAPETHTLVDEPYIAPVSAEGAPVAAPDDPERRRRLLSAGVQDITESLAGDCRLGDLMPMILETLYRAIGYKRALLLVRDPERNCLRARHGFGVDAETLVKSGFAIPVSPHKDVFYAAVSQGLDLCVEDRDAENIRHRVPAWYRDAIDARGLILFPVLVKKRVVALIYADADDPALLRYRPEELSLLRTLRNQAVLALMHAAS
ncbi:MAG: HDOD domain-containing protein [Betaproteobacteria bacterium]|nr:HDOD domain-containing protein [Betaproteobacteria bacterium]